MRTRVQWEGVHELRATLRRAGANLGDLKVTHVQVAEHIRPVARAGAPVRSGALAATVRASGTKSDAFVRAGFARVPYANPIHWGWPARGIRANRFVSKAVLATQTRWVGIYRDGVQRILNRVRGA